MGVLSNELSSWRKNIVECKSGEVKTLDFKDTRPNVMLVMNPSANQILCSIDRIPTLNHYDFNIKNHYARLVGKPTPTSQVYFLNNGSSDCTLQVYSIYDKNFDPSWLSDFSIDNININEESVQAIVEAISKNAGLKKSDLSFDNSDKLFVRDSDVYSKFNYLTKNIHTESLIGLYDLLQVLNNISEYFNPASSNNEMYQLLAQIPDMLQVLMTGNSTSSTTTLKGVGVQLDEIQEKATDIESCINTLMSAQPGLPKMNVKTLYDQLVIMTQHLSTISSSVSQGLPSIVNLLADIKTNTTPTT